MLPEAYEGGGYRSFAVVPVGFLFLFAFLIWVTGYDIIRSLGGGGT